MLATQGYGLKAGIVTQGYGGMLMLVSRNLSVKFDKASSICSIFKTTNTIGVIMERVIESFSGTIEAPPSPIPTPTIEVKDLEAIFEKANSIKIGYFGKGE